MRLTIGFILSSYRRNISVNVFSPAYCPIKPAPSRPAAGNAISGAINAVFSISLCYKKEADYSTHRENHNKL
jgi:hypothetical protein